MRVLGALLLLLAATAADARGTKSFNNLTLSAGFTPIPNRQLYSFTKAVDACNQFGAGTTSCTWATAYFAGAPPGAVDSFTPFPIDEIAPAAVYGADRYPTTLATLQGLSGTLKLTGDGYNYSAAVNLTGAASFAAAATSIQSAFNGGTNLPFGATVPGAIAPVTVNAYATFDGTALHIDLTNSLTSPAAPTGIWPGMAVCQASTPCTPASADYIGQLGKAAPYTPPYGSLNWPGAVYAINCVGAAIACPQTVNQWKTAPANTPVTGGSASGTDITLNFGAITKPVIGATVIVTGITSTGGANMNCTAGCLITASSTTSITYAKVTAADTWASGGAIAWQPVPVTLSGAELTLSSNITVGAVVAGQAVYGGAAAETYIDTLVSGTGQASGSVWGLNLAQTVSATTFTTRAPPMLWSWNPVTNTGTGSQDWGYFSYQRDPVDISDSNGPANTISFAADAGNGLANALGVAATSVGQAETIPIPYPNAAITPTAGWVTDPTGSLAALLAKYSQWGNVQLALGGPPTTPELVYRWASMNGVAAPLSWGVATSHAASAPGALAPAYSGLRWTKSLPVTFAVDDAPSYGPYRDTETRALIGAVGPYGPAVYGCTGDWQDTAINSLPSTSGAQIARFDDVASGSPTAGQWTSDFVLNQSAGGGKRLYMACSALDTETFTSDSSGNPVSPAVQVMIASTWGNAGVSYGQTDIIDRIGASGSWTVHHLSLTGGYGQARSFALHTDSVTGIQMLFMGTDPLGVYSATYNSSTQAMNYSASAEAGTTATALANQPPSQGLPPRIMSMIECNGKLYASFFKAILVRNDGASPSWTNYYEAPVNDPTTNPASSGFRGLQCVPDPANPGGPNVLLFFSETIDPYGDAAAYRLPTTTPTRVTERDFVTLMDAALGPVTVTSILPSYNKTPISPVTGSAKCPDYVIGMFVGATAYVGAFGTGYPDPEYLIRHCDGSYDGPYVIADPAVANFPALASLRTIIWSPLASDSPCAMWAGGFDAGTLGALAIPVNTGWIYHGVPAANGMCRPGATASTSVTCSVSASYPAPLGAGTTLCTASVAPGGWSGRLSLSGPDAASFVLSGSSLEVGASPLSAGSYSVQINATP